MQRIYANWKDFPMSEWRWKNFSPQEMACRGTGKLMIDPKAMDKLQALRDLLGRPLIVNSAYRSPEHNKAVGGAKNSFHMKANAYDVRMDNHDPAEYIDAAIAVGFTGIGTYPKQNFVHVDDRGYEARWGKAFKKRAATPQFAVEAVRPPANPLKREEVQGTGLGILALTLQVSEGAKKVIGDLTETFGMSPEAAISVIGGAACIWLFRKPIKSFFNFGE